METLDRGVFRDILMRRRPILDVRAPVEFAQGSIPGSVNLPILNDGERHEIGTIYKQLGHDAAVERGHELVSGAVKAERVAAWGALARAHDDLILTCFRGGMRSRLAQSWLKDNGFARPRLAGGYKAFRNFLLEELARASRIPMVAVTGATGAGKTLVVANTKREKVDLEGLARHRGSAFGAMAEPQPSQIDFENQLARELLELKGPIVVEDESRMIGRIVVPESFFLTLRESPVVVVDETLAERVRLTHQIYIAEVPPGSRVRVFAGYRESLKNISRKLGGALFAQVLGELDSAIARPEDTELHLPWIEKVLNAYYDPLYRKSFDKRRPKVLFRGRRDEVTDFLNAREFV